MAKHTDVVSENIKQEAPMGLGELGEKTIERMSENDFAKNIPLENFMNDVLTIIVHPAADEGSLDVITPNVNSLNQPIIRGVESPVKRKYVEALARCRTTKYTQKVMDPGRPESIQMQPRTIVTYPFSVIHDPDPNGPAWLKAIMEQQ